MRESIKVQFTLPATAREVYDAWLDGAKHSAMTGARATASREVGGEFSAWDNYIRGKNLLLIENQKIVQSWRSSEFPEDAPDSVLSIQLTERYGTTEVELVHSDIPPGHAVQYQSGWIEFYANPMQKYFAAIKEKKMRQRISSTTPTARAKPASKPGRRTKKSGPANKTVTNGKKKSSRAIRRGKK
jgi:activator of HSP90 ATPase